ncbi:hypothetical protein C0991_002843 [Blastosporella zonata]|nr:hypothetical protein C0991_002843 [Blastosporella zonata]
MFANILRSQARLALTSCRARVSAVAVSRVATRIPSIPTVSALRTISTSKAVWNSDNAAREQPPPSNTLFVGNLPYSISEAELRERFEPFGEIASIRVAYQPDGRARGFAHVEFVNTPDAVAAMTSVAEEPMYLLDRDLRVNYAAGRRAPAEREPSNTLYFHGFSGTLEDLRSASGQYDTSIVNIHFLKDRHTGMENGSGFLHFTSVVRATEALSSLNGRRVGDEEFLRLRFASPPRDGGRDGRRDGGNRGSRDGGNRGSRDGGRY